MVRPILLLLLALAGCAGVPEYRAAASAPRQGAVVRGHWSWATWRPFITIDKIEGLPRSRWDTASGPVLVDPGTRTLTVTGHKPGFLDPDDYLEGTVELKATLKPGHSYLVRFEIGQKLMTFWVEDETTREMASEKCSTDATISPFHPGTFLIGPMFHF